MSTDPKLKPEERARRLLVKLQSLREDRGTMAALRHARLEGADMRAFPAYGCLGVVADVAGQAVAVFFASHPEHSESGSRYNFGGSCHRLTAGNKPRFPRDQKNRCSFDARFRRILASHDRSALITRIRQVLPLLEREGIPVDYVRLYRDLVRWNYDADAVRLRWSQSYWGGLPDWLRLEGESEPAAEEVK